MKNFLGKQGVNFEPFENIGFSCLPVLPALVGKKWDCIALAFVHSLRPSAIRVIVYDGCGTLDAWDWRVTVYLNVDMTIRRIEQEVEVGLPDGITNGHSLSIAQIYGTDSPQMKWAQIDSDEYHSYIGGVYKMWKKLPDGTTAMFPDSEYT